MIRKIMLVLASAVAALLVWVGLKPSVFHVERSALINAAPSAVFEHVNDFRKWEAWSPWAKRDPAAKAVFEGSPTGPGAIFRWSGNDEVGEGSMKIVEAKPGEAIKIDLAFTKPFEGNNAVSFAFRPEGAGTRVTWSLDGEQGYIERLFCTIMNLNMDRMIGGDYEQGLAALKSVVEGKAPG